MHSIDKLWILVSFVAMTGVNACDDFDAVGKAKVTNQCEATDGVLNAEGRCVCNGEVCADSKWCTSAGECSENTDLTFDFLCVSSGGEADGGRCLCKGETCVDGEICNLTSGKCPAPVSSGQPTASGDCNGFTKSCADNSQGIGIVNDCASGIEFQHSCTTVSCNEDKTDCGECKVGEQICKNDSSNVGQVTKCENGKEITESCEDKSCNPTNDGCGKCRNYGKTCINDELGIGKISECQNGSDSAVTEFCNNVSCRTDMPACGECKDGDLKCTNDIDDYAVMWRCVDGKWNEITDKTDPDYPPSTSTKRVHGYCSECSVGAQGSEADKIRDFDLHLTNKTCLVQCRWDELWRLPQ